MYAFWSWSGYICRVFICFTGTFFNPPGVDYFSLRNTGVIISELGIGCVDISVRDDDIAESPEQFFVNISVPFGTRGIMIQPNSTATVTILDDGDGMNKYSLSSNRITYIIQPNTVAVYGFTQREYSVTEGGRVHISLVTLQGSVGTANLTIRIYSMDGSASGELPPQFYMYS